MYAIEIKTVPTWQTPGVPIELFKCASNSKQASLKIAGFLDFPNYWNLDKLFNTC